MVYIDGYLEKFWIKTHLNFKNMSSFNVSLFQKMLPFGGFLLVSISALFFSLFEFFSKVFSRIQRDKPSQPKNLVPIETEDVTEEKTEEAKADSTEMNSEENEVVEEKESPKFFFKFQYQTQTFEEVSRKGGGDRNYNVGLELESVPCTSTKKYEYNSGNDFSCVMEKPEELNFCVKELYSDSRSGFLSDEDSLEQNLNDEAVTEAITEHKKKVPDKTRVEAEQVEETASGKETVDVEKKFPSQQEVSGDFQFLSEKDFTLSETDMASVHSSPEHMSNFIGSGSDGFLSDIDSEEDFDVDSSRNGNTEKRKENFDLGEAGNFDNKDRDIMEELRKLEESGKQDEGSKQEVSGNDNGSAHALDNSEKSNLENSFASDSEDSSALETLWEHQDLIEQLKMELKKVRATGLPTILEESESPKIMDDLKPWKIDEKFQHVDRMSELHKFYKSYRERMRKFDILNYQKMYAIGFLQSKDPLQSISSQKSSTTTPAITSLLSQNLRLGRRKKPDFDPMTKFIKELHSDLEMVYVGQLCLSWEILHWQYEKVIEIWESDPYGLRRYNEVAGEFQQFQVLMQRFIENEPFEGARVQNYVKNRCVLRNLLQVPVIRVDNMKDKRKARRKGRDDDDDAITSDMLVEIMEESIRIFWRFVRADKDANIVIQKTRNKGTQVEPLEPDELELLAEVQTSLQKKDKKLKDILRSGNCILRKFKKSYQEENSDQVLYFFSQVDLKLVARVLNMSKVTKDQLFWCHSKLSKINFVNRKINVEPSFLLFPC